MNTGSGPNRPNNRLLGTLADGDLQRVSRHLDRVPFAIGDVLATAGDPIESICFPEGAIAAILDPLTDGSRLAVGLVGFEGFVGWPLLLGNDRWPHDVVMRADRGTALRLDAAVLQRLVVDSEALRRRLLQFANIFMVQMSRTIVSALVHSVERRMARWILLYHDRLTSDDICVTHEEFRLMLGVRRSSITDALHRLEEVGAIRAVRGRTIVRDRAKLVDLAGDTYGSAEREYRRLLLDEPPSAPAL